MLGEYLIAKKNLIVREYAAGLVIKKYQNAKSDSTAKSAASASALPRQGCPNGVYVFGLHACKANKKSSSAANKSAEVYFEGGEGVVGPPTVGPLAAPLGLRCCACGNRFWATGLVRPADQRTS